jgi:succinoglycan biosynthesis protein ExoV
VRRVAVYINTPRKVCNDNMELLYYRDLIGNFGDDLNESIWQKLLPAHVFEAVDTVLMGIGSIFNARSAPLSLTRGKKVFVIGSGAGYGALPSGWDSWNILGVRGPLTAELIGKPELAMTDSAALLSSLPSIARVSPGADRILLIPHFHSITRGRWDRVAREAGMTFVDPRWPVATVMEHFSHAKLVVTEAMHGAIVADTLRIPWLPIVIAPSTLPFKWKDWTLSLGLPYEPVAVGASSAWEAMFHRDLVRRAKMEGLVAPALMRDTESVAYLIADFKKRYKVPPAEKEEELRKGSSGHLGRLLRSTSQILDGWFVENAARHLRKVVLKNPYLSRDDSFSRRVEQLSGAVDQFVKAVS